MVKRLTFLKFHHQYFSEIVISVLIVSVIGLLYLFYLKVNQNQSLTYQNSTANKRIASLSTELNRIRKERDDLKSQDQYVINQKLSEEVKNIYNSYQNSVSTYEKLLSLKDKVKNTDELDKLYTQAIVSLSNKNYASGQASLTLLNTKIKEQNDKLVASFEIPQNIAVNNSPPANGYQRQQVQTDEGAFLVDIVSGDLSSTKVVVDTASDSTCKANCPVLSLSDFVSRSGAYAGVNGSYFCPSTYPSCVGKENSFDTLLMNKNKVYFNSDNNVYSTVPAVIFGSGWVRFVGRSLEWGRDTGVDGVIANQPLLVSGGNISFTGDSDPKHSSRGNRSYVGNKGNTVYIGVVLNATVGQAAKVLKTLGFENALNLDDGGSTALWFAGYKTGPGRNIPNAVLFVRK